LISAEQLFDDVSLEEGVPAPARASSTALHRKLLERSHEQLVQRLKEAGHALERQQAIRDTRHFLATEEEYLERLGSGDPEQAAARDELLELYFKLKRKVDGADPANVVRNPVLEAAAPPPPAEPAPASIRSTQWAPRRQVGLFFKLLIVVGLAGLGWLGWQAWQVHGSDGRPVQARPQVAVPGLAPLAPTVGPDLGPARAVGPGLQKVLLILLPRGLRADAWAQPPAPERPVYSFTWLKDGKQFRQERQPGAARGAAILPSDTLVPGAAYQVSVSINAGAAEGEALLSEKVVVPLLPDQGVRRAP